MLYVGGHVEIRVIKSIAALLLNTIDNSFVFSGFQSVCFSCSSIIFWRWRHVQLIQRTDLNGLGQKIKKSLRLIKRSEIANWYYAACFDFTKSVNLVLISWKYCFSCEKIKTIGAAWLSSFDEIFSVNLLAVNNFYDQPITSISYIIEKYSCQSISVLVGDVTTAQVAPETKCP